MTEIDKILKKIMHLSYPLCRHGSTDENLVELFREINGLAHEAEVLMSKEKFNDHISNNPKDLDN